MSTLSDFFPAASGGGGGIVKQEIITSSGTLDLTSLGIADGDLIQLFLVGGGGGGARYQGGFGGNILSISQTLGTAGTVTVVIGAGGAAGTGNITNGGDTTITGGGLTGTLKAQGGIKPNQYTTPTSTAGYMQGGLFSYSDDSIGIGGTNAGYGQGGLAGASSVAFVGNANTGNGGGGGTTTSASSNRAGGSGLVIIYYT